MFRIFFHDQNFLRRSFERIFNLSENFRHLIHRDRFINEINSAFHQTLLSHLHRGHHVNRNWFGFRIGFQFVHHLPTIFHRKLNIQQNSGRMILQRGRKCVISSHCDDAFVILLSRIFQKCFCKIGVIFDNQNHFVFIGDIISIISHIFRNF
ncbi:hypothetical protein D3C86_1639760 [compost metagenome]